MASGRAILPVATTTGKATGEALTQLGTCCPAVWVEAPSNLQTETKTNVILSILGLYVLNETWSSQGANAASLGPRVYLKTDGSHVLSRKEHREVHRIMNSWGEVTSSTTF